MDIKIRLEKPKDYDKVNLMIKESFFNVFEPGANEHFLAHKIRQSTTDFISELCFVATRAEDDEDIVAQIMYTKAQVVNDTITNSVASFGPVCVRNDLKGKGIGGKLILHSLNEVARLKMFPAVFILGDPAYYGRFGFRCAEKWDITTSDGFFCPSLMVYPIDLDMMSKMASGLFMESSVFSEFDVEEFKSFEEEFCLHHQEQSIRLKIETNTESQQRFNVLRSLRYNRKF